MRRVDSPTQYIIAARSLEIRFRDRVIQVRLPYPPDATYVDHSMFDVAITMQCPEVEIADHGAYGTAAHQKLANYDLVIDINEEFPDANATP